MSSVSSSSASSASASASASASSTNITANTPAAFPAPDESPFSSPGGRLSRSRASSSFDGSRNRGGTGYTERRRAYTLNAPDRRKGPRLADLQEHDDDDDDDDDSFSWPRRMRAGTVVEQGSSRDRDVGMAAGAGARAGSGSAVGSSARPVDLALSSPPQPSSPWLGQWPALEGNDYMEYVRPRWQSDDEVTECPICQVQFSFWYRKHHCRKCGRVVCASCSPHRITIPRQYIVHPPGVDGSSVSAFVPSRVDLQGGTPVMSPSVTNPALGGGEEVRLCNPCVPDPNPEPPRVFVQPTPPRHRSHQSMSVPRQRPHGVFGESTSRPGRRTVGSNDYPCLAGLNIFGGGLRETPMGFGFPTPQQPLPPADGGSLSPARSPRPSRRHINERDICPICNQRFPPLGEDDNEEPREAHIRDCIESHGPRARSSSQTGSGPGPGLTPGSPVTQPPLLPVRMVAFTATEKDCLGHDAGPQECTICMEEYEVGEPLVRLECLCKFHRRCVVEWFERKKECPVHKVS